MAEESNLGVARARETDDQPTTLDLQHRMDEARESITDAVSEINVADVDQFGAADHHSALDWRERVRKHPLAFGMGALGVGILVGYGLAGLVEGEGESDYDAENDHSHESHIQIEGGGPSAFSDDHSYAAHARAVARVDDEQASIRESKPGIFDRFKETRAYDRLHEEVADLGSRVVDGAVEAARALVVPLVLGKLREIIGLDSSNKGPSAKTATRPPVSSATSGQSAPMTEEDLPLIPPSEVGKAAYPKTKSPLNKFDRLAGNQNATDSKNDSTPHINLIYDDRYERESKLFSRGEIRGFDKAKPGESKPSVTDADKSETGNVSHGSDYKYDAGVSTDGLGD